MENKRKNMKVRKHKDELLIRIPLEVVKALNIQAGELSVWDLDTEENALIFYFDRTDNTNEKNKNISLAELPYINKFYCDIDKK